MLTIKQFLKDESGFLGLVLGGLGALAGSTAAGTFLGGSALWGGIGSAVGSYLDQDRAEDAKNRQDENYFVDLARRAEKGGFHPLEALRAGGGGGYSAQLGRPPIGSSVALQNSYDKLSDIISGDYAREKARQEVQDEYNRIQLDRLKATPLGGFSAGLGSYSPKEAGPEADLPVIEDGRERTTAVEEGYRYPFSRQDAEDHEAAYSEIGGWFKGVKNLWYDSQYRALRDSDVAAGLFPDQKTAHEHYRQTDPGVVARAMAAVRDRRDQTNLERGGYSDEWPDPIPNVDPVYQGKLRMW